MKFDYDLIVIGSGAGGSVGAHYAANLGKKVAVIEKSIIGGECPNYACVPTKALLHAAEVYELTKQAEDYGIIIRRAALDYKLVHRWKNTVVSRTGTSHGEAAFRQSKIDLIKGNAKFLSPHQIAIGNKRLTAHRFIIATGSSVAVPPIPGLKEAGYQIFAGAVDFHKLPKSIFILGGGAIGCEFTQIFASFGVRVTLADALPRLLAKEDEEVSSLLQALFENRGVKVLNDTMVTKITKQNDKKIIHYTLNNQEHTTAAEEILIATGKKPNLELDLERAGVACDKHGVKVNAYLQTSSPHIYAAGDIVGPYLFTHTGEYQSHIAAHNAFSNKKVKPDYRVVPRCVFTKPEVASVGLGEQEAKERYGRIKKGIAPFVAIGRANTSNEFDGFVKVITDTKGKLLGGSIVGPRAGEIIHELAVAIKYRATAVEVANLIHAYPTFSEALKVACSVVE